MSLVDTMAENPEITALLAGGIAGGTAYVAFEAEPLTAGAVALVTTVGSYGLIKMVSPTPFVAQVGDLKAEVRDQGKTVSVKLNIPKSKEAAATVADLLGGSGLPAAQQDAVNKMFKAA